MAPSETSKAFGRRARVILVSDLDWTMVSYTCARSSWDRLSKLGAAGGPQ